jgi:hypothetical protein
MWTYILVKLDPAISEIFKVFLLYQIVSLVVRLFESFDDNSDEYIEEEKGDKQEVGHEKCHSSP